MIRLHSLLGLVCKGPDRRAGRSPRPAAFRPTLEALEARETPSSLSKTSDFSGLCGDGGGKGGDGFMGFVPVYKWNGNHVTYVYVC